MEAAAASSRRRSEATITTSIKNGRMAMRLSHRRGIRSNESPESRQETLGHGQFHRGIYQQGS